MIFFPIKRATLFIPSGPKAADGQTHLFVILTDPCHEKRVLHVSVTSKRPGCFFDPACLLFKGDHSRIIHDSYVYYRDCRIQSAQELVNGAKDGTLIPQESIGTEIFARICYGLTTSDFTSQEALAYYESRHKIS